MKCLLGPFIIGYLLVNQCAVLNANWMYIAISGAQIDQAKLSLEPIVDYENERDQTQARPVRILQICNETFDLNEHQTQVCAKQPAAMPSVSNGVRTGLYECQFQFKYERWNCSNIQSKPSDVLGPTIRAYNRESAFIAAVTSSGIVHQITRGCSTGNLTECGCDNKVRAGQPSGTDQDAKWHWGGCSDNVAYGARFAEDFLDRYEEEQYLHTNDVRHKITVHNHGVGRLMVQRMMKRQCRCHGVSGSCEFKTCWMQLPNFQDVGDYLKMRYERYTVRVAKTAKRRLRRKKKSDRKTVIGDSELVFLNKSPNYCVFNDTAGVWGTSERRCNATSLRADSCNLLCCGRGYNTRVETVTEKCSCKFVWCCYVKCKWCQKEVEVHTCK